jgi:hypothetical protein
LHFGTVSEADARFLLYRKLSQKLRLDFFGVIYYYFSEFNRETERTLACSSRGASAYCDFAYLFFFAPLEYLFDLLLVFFGAVLQSTVS